MDRGCYFNAIKHSHEDEIGNETSNDVSRLTFRQDQTLLDPNDGTFDVGQIRR